MSITALFESLGFTLGVRLARPRGRPLPSAQAPAAAPRGGPARRRATASRRSRAPGRAPELVAAAGKRGRGPESFKVGERVLYKQGRGTFSAVIVRHALDGRLVVTREKDGKRVLREARLLERIRKSSRDE